MLGGQVGVGEGASVGGRGQVLGGVLAKRRGRTYVVQGCTYATLIDSPFPHTQTQCVTCVATVYRAVQLPQPHTSTYAGGCIPLRNPCSVSFPLTPSPAAKPYTPCPSLPEKNTRAGVEVVPARGANVLSLMRRDYLILTKPGLDALVTRLTTPINRWVAAWV